MGGFWLQNKRHVNNVTTKLGRFRNQSKVCVEQSRATGVFNFFVKGLMNFKSLVHKAIGRHTRIRLTLIEDEPKGVFIEIWREHERGQQETAFKIQLENFPLLFDALKQAKEELDKIQNESQVPATQ